MLSDRQAIGLRRGTAAVREYDARWPVEFEREAARLRALFGELAPEIEHVGSTAVQGLAAKPVLDIALAYRDESALAETCRLLSAAGYEFRGDLGDDGGVVFAKGPESSRTHYLHLVPAGSVQWFDYVAFRDGLRENQTLRDEYAALKKELAARFPLDRPSYQKGKERFVEETLAASRSGQRSR